MQLHSVNCSWLNNDVGDRFMRFERTAAIDILALVVTFFGVEAQITT